MFSKKDLKIIVIATSIGGVVQYFCWKYVKNHPEVFDLSDGENLKKNEPIETPIKGPFLFSGRGGEIVTVSITGVQIILNLGKLIFFLKGHGAAVFFTTATTAVLVKKIPTTAVSTITRFIRKHLSSVSPVSHTDWEKGHIAEINSLGECNHDFKYLVSVLSDKEIPYHDRRKKALMILNQQLNSKTLVSLVHFLTCIVSILMIFTLLGDTTNLFLMMQNLLQLLKDGKVSKRVVRILIRKLIREGVPIDPELIEAVSN